MYNMDDTTFEESGNFTQRRKEKLNSEMFGQNIEDLPYTLKVMDECLQKSNQNIFELKESLKFVLEREGQLQYEFDILQQRYEFTKRLYSGKCIQLTNSYGQKLNKLQEVSKRVARLEQELEAERKKAKDQEKELSSMHTKYLKEHEKLINCEKDMSKLKMAFEKLSENIKTSSDDCNNWKERYLAIKSLLESREKDKEDTISAYETEKISLKKTIEKYEDALRKYETKEKKWIEISEERKVNDTEIKAKLEETRLTFKELERVKKEQDEENNKLKIENSGLKHRVEGLENEMENSKKQNIKDLGEKSRISEELEKIHQELAVRENKLKEISERREKYIKELEAQVTFSSAKISEIQAYTKKQENLLDQMRNENSQQKLQLSDLIDKLSKEQEDKLAKNKKFTQIEESFQQLTQNYQNVLYSCEQAEIQLRTLQVSSKKSEEVYEKEILRLRNTITETTFAFEEKLQSVEYEKTRTETELKKAKTEFTSYESTSRKAHGEIELWKAGLLEISCLKVLEKPRVEDMLRALLGVAPERMSNYDIEQAEYVNGVIKKIKDILMRETSIGSVQGGEALERTQYLLQEVTDKYRKEMAERRRLHQLLQDLRGNIRVMCRVRPLGHSERNLEECITVMDTCQVKVMNGVTRRENWFEFDRVFPPTDSQEVVYYEVSDLVTSAMNGFNVCILAYGQTGSGKTYTMEGTSRNLGINYRALKEIFEIIESRTETHKYSIEISILEVYNEQIRDLLNPSTKKIEIREDAKGNMHMPGVDVYSAHTYTDIIKAIEAGKTNRSVGCTNINEYSSRSHCIVTIYIHCTANDENFMSKLNLIDLAGSERICKSEAEGLRMFEACNINQSLSALGKVLYSLAGKQPHIPYRDSKLTHLLRDSLSGDAKTMMIITVNPSHEDVSESSSSLSFGSRVASVEKGKAKQQTKKKKKKETST